MAINVVPGMNISATGMAAERQRMEVASHNLANANATRDNDGGIFRRRQVIFSEILTQDINQPFSTAGLGGVKIAGIVKDDRPPVEIYAPHHPHANAEGMVRQSGVSAVEEMLDLMTATRAYEANLAALKQSRDMVNQTINLLRHGN